MYESVNNMLTGRRNSRRRSSGFIEQSDFQFVTVSHVSEQGPDSIYIKMLSYQYRKYHCGDKTVVRSSYLHNGISYTGKMTSLY